MRRLLLKMALSITYINVWKVLNIVLGLASGILFAYGAFKQQYLLIGIGAGLMVFIIIHHTTMAIVYINDKEKRNENRQNKF